MILGAILYGIFTGRIIDYRSQKMQEYQLTDQKVDSLNYIRKEYALNDATYYSVLEALRAEKKETE